MTETPAMDFVRGNQGDANMNEINAKLDEIKSMLADIKDALKRTQKPEIHNHFHTHYPKSDKPKHIDPDTQRSDWVT